MLIKNISLVAMLFLSLPLNAGLFDYFTPKTLGYVIGAIGLTTFVGYCCLDKIRNKYYFRKTNGSDPSVREIIMPLINQAYPSQNMNFKQSNAYSGKKKLIIEALQSEIVFTHQHDPKPIAATYGCNPCVAFGAYEDANKFVALAHFSTAAEVRQAQTIIFQHMSNLKTPITKPIQVHLRGGHKNESECTIEAIRMFIKQRHDLPMEIVSEDILNNNVIGSLLIDSRTGKVDSYYPSSNSHRRNFEKREELSAINSAFAPNMRVVYPQLNVRKITNN